MLMPGAKGSPEELRSLAQRLINGMISDRMKTNRLYLFTLLVPELTVVRPTGLLNQVYGDLEMKQHLKVGADVFPDQSQTEVWLFVKIPADRIINVSQVDSVPPEFEFINQ
jgi:hypothetical protein